MASEHDGGDDYATPAYVRAPGAWEERVRVAGRGGGSSATPSRATSSLSTDGSSRAGADAVPTSASPSRPTSHRRSAAAPQRHVPLRTSATLALVTGLAITTPLMLRTQKHEIALGPEHAQPGTVTDAVADGPDGPGSPGSPGSPDRSDSPGGTAGSAAVGAASTGDRTGPPVSRNGTRSPAGVPAGPPSATATATATTVPARAGQLSPDQAGAFENQVVTLTNAQRTAHGCPALRSDTRLQLAAIGHSVDMRARNYFAHDAPGGATPWTRIEAQGYSDPSAENIALGQATPQAVVDAWMNSPGHRANILNCSSKAVGVGVVLGPGGPWWTQDFGYS